MRVGIENGQIAPQFLVQGGKTVPLIGQDGAGIVSGGGGNFTLTGTLSSLASDDGSLLGGIFAKNSILSQPVRPAGNPAAGIVGNFVARGSGGSNPVIIITEDPETGEPIYTAEITLDDTSNPRIGDVQGLAFTFALNAPVIQFAATSVTVNEAAGQATVNVVRTGDTTGVAFVEYATSDGTANAGSDYAATSGRLTFAPGETSKTFTVTVFTDRVNERSENFLVKLNAIANAAFDNREMQVTITNTLRKGRTFRRRQ